jgi:hypothetical protein
VGVNARREGGISQVEGLFRNGLRRGRCTVGVPGVIPADALILLTVSTPRPAATKSGSAARCREIFFELMAKLVAVTGTNLQGLSLTSRRDALVLGGATGWTIGRISDE